MKIRINMATSVISAFNTFQKDIVNLESSMSITARASRDWLLEQISKFPDKNSYFPLLYPEINIAFGSFARKTKTRPLDDIDLMVGINADGCYYSENSWNDIKLYFPENYTGRLKNYADTRNSSYLSSTRITNAFKNELGNISQYSSADIKRDGEAATLKMVSYPWNFDIVPCFFTKPDIFGKTYYLIPNRNGGWKKTDPRLDRDRLSTVNQNQSGNVLDVIRILKYWKQAKRINMGSYLLEAMILYYYESKPNDTCSSYVDLELESVFTYLGNNILYSVADPKKIQIDINDIEYYDRYLLRDKFIRFAQLSSEARRLENEQKMKESINKWKEVFGDNFPNYG